MERCRWCGVVLDMEVKPGPSPIFCSGRCRVAAHRASKGSVLPVEMIRERRWVRADGKRPITCAGRPASSVNGETWAAFGLVRKSRAGDGFGFMLGNGVGCIDLDHCIVDGVLSDFAAAVLAACPETYVEVSRSGTGLHIFGFLPEGPGRVRPGCEVYSRSRFIAVTGVVFEGSSRRLSDLSDLVKLLPTL